MNDKKIANRVASYLFNADMMLVFSGDNTSAFNDVNYKVQKNISDLEKRLAFDSTMMRSDASGNSELTIRIDASGDKHPISESIFKDAQMIASDVGLRCELVHLK